MAMPHQIPDQAAVIPDRPGTLAVGHSSRLNDCRVVSHVVNEGDEPVRKHGVFHANFTIGVGNGGTPHRGGIVSHGTGEDVPKIKAASEVVEQSGKT
jgi:hypothetical protein